MFKTVSPQGLAKTPQVKSNRLYQSAAHTATQQGFPGKTDSFSDFISFKVPLGTQ